MFTPLGPLISPGGVFARGDYSVNASLYRTVLGSFVTPWANAVVANGGTVSTARIALISALIAGHVSTGLWDAAYDIALPAAENEPQALTTLKRRTLMTLVGGMTFTADRGYLGDGTSGYINTNSIPPMASRARLSIYERTSLAATTSSYAIAAADSSVTGGTWAIRPLTAASAAGVNVLSGGSTITTNAVSKGYTVVSKDAANLATLIKDGTAMGSATGGTNATQAITIPIYIGARNQSGVANGFRAAQEAYADWGDIIPLANEAAAAAAIIAHLTAIGANT